MRSAFLCLLLSASCADSALDPVLGDWFACATPECAVLTDFGVRFASDLFLFELDAPGDTLDDDERYCTWPSVTKYTWSDGQLELESPKRRALRFEVTGDRAIQREPGAPDLAFLRVSENSKGPCDAGDGPRIISFTATPQSVMRGGSTTLSWVVEQAGQIDLYTVSPERLISIAAPPTSSLTLPAVLFESAFKLVARGRNATVEQTLTVRVPDALERIVESVGRPYAIAADADQVFWVENAGALKKAALDGSGAAPLSDQSFDARWVVAAGDEVFAVVTPRPRRSDILRLGKDGGAPQTIATAQMLGDGSQLRIAGDYLYWSEVDYDTQRAAIKRRRRDGSGSIEPLKAQLHISDSAFGFSGGRLIHRDSSADGPVQVYASDLDGTNTATVGEMLERGRGFIVVEGALFWTTAQPVPPGSLVTQIHRLELDGSGATSVITESDVGGAVDGEAAAIAADETNLYFALAGGSSTVLSIPQTGGPVNVLSAASGFVWTIAVNADHVYWSDDQGDIGHIVRWPKR